MEDNIKLTLVMQNYNVSKDILIAAIDSVMYQTYKHFNFIFIDDWSTDYDVNIFFEEWRQIWHENKMNGKFITVTCPKSSDADTMNHNHGHSFCRNFGLDTCETEFIMFMDSDDELRICSIQLLMENLENREDDVDISIGNFTRNEITWNTIKTYYSGCYQNDHNATVYNSINALHVLCHPYMFPGYDNCYPSIQFCATWNKIFRKSLFDDIRFPDFKTKDDNFTAHRLLYKARKIIYTEEITYYYRPGGQLADGNLYKTWDLLDAHKDRIVFFIEIFLDYLSMVSEKEIKKDDFNEYYTIIKIFFNELLILMHTAICCIKHTDADISSKNAEVNLLRSLIKEYKTELFLYNPAFVFSAICFIDEWRKQLNENDHNSIQ